MDAQSYYESLLAQGYGPEAATQFTQQHYPGFGQAPVDPQPTVMPAPQPMAAPAPQPMIAAAPQPQMISGQVDASLQPMLVASQSQNTSKGMRITNGIFGIMMSLILIFYSLYVIGLWAELSEDLEDDAELFETASDSDDDFAKFYDGLESFVSTISLFYYAVLLISLVTLVMSVVQFLDKSWGTKALLCSTGLLLILLLATASYETSSFTQISEDYENLTDEELGKISFFEVNGTIGGYCAGLCFVVYGLLALIGRPKSPPVQVVMN